MLLLFFYFFFIFSFLTSVSRVQINFSHIINNQKLKEKEYVTSGQPLKGASSLRSWTLNLWETQIFSYMVDSNQTLFI